jgi:cell division protein ZapA
MTDQAISVTIELLGKPYVIRCPESEVKSLQQAAAVVNQKMTEIQESGKAINLERIAIITALNIAHDYLQIDQHKSSIMTKINHRIAQLQDRIDSAINHTLHTELVYSSE